MRSIGQGTRRGWQRGYIYLFAAVTVPLAAIVYAVTAMSGLTFILLGAALGVAATLIVTAMRGRSQISSAVDPELASVAEADATVLAEPRRLAALAAHHIAQAAGVSRCEIFVFEADQLRWAGGVHDLPTRAWMTAAAARSVREYRIFGGADEGVDAVAMMTADVSRFLVLPLKAQGEMSAIACLPVPEGGFSERQQRDGARAADLAALALSAGHLYRTQSDLAKQLRERSIVVEALLQLGNDLRATFDLEAVLKLVGHTLIDELGYNEAAIYLYDPELDCLLTRCALGGSAELNAVYLAQPIPMHIVAGYLRDEFRIGNSYFRSATRAPITLEEERYLPCTTLAVRSPGEWQSGDTLFIPMHTRDNQLLGIIDPYDPRDRRAPTPDSVRVLELFANLAAVAIENALQYEVLESQGKRLERQISAHEHLLTVSESVLTTLDQKVVFRAIDDQLRRLVEYDTLSIDRVDWQSRTLKAIYARDDAYGADVMLSMTVAVGQGLCGWVAEHDEAILVNDVLSDSRGVVIPGTVADEPQASIVVPLTVQKRVLGVLSIDRLGGRHFGDEDFHLVKVFASQAAIAIQNAELYQRIQHRAITDSLTGLYNHGHFQETLVHEIARCERYRESVSLIMLDLDHFKEVNDRYGHPSGDRVLRRVADALTTCSREADYVARYGGEEFVLLLPGTTREDACNLAERVRAEISSISAGVGDGYHLAVSLGVADYPACAQDGDTLIAAADAALLWAKRHGRDRVEYFGALADAS
ncbi:MAG: diguanylate cyclase [Thermoleophilia bacterium]